MEITFWGTRGSIASPGAETLHYGGNTSCVSLLAGGKTFVFDCGTGARRLGTALLEQHRHGLEVNLFISHCHWDHIQGFPFFAPLFVAGTSCNVFAPHEHNQRLHNTMAGQMQYRYFPVELDHLGANVRYQELREDAFKIGDVRISTRYLNHTTVTMAYRLDYGGRSFVYATDTEPYAAQPRAWADPDKRRFIHSQDEELAQFFLGADVLVMDSQYTPEEYPAKASWGHGTYQYALDLAMTAGVKTLVLYHHDPIRTDLAMEALLRTCWQRVASARSELVVTAAAEGMSMALPEHSGPPLEATRTKLPQFRHSIHLALIGASDDVADMATKGLTDAHFALRRFDDVQELTAAAVHQFHPHLLLLQPRRKGEIGRMVRQLKGMGHYAKLPVLALLPEGRSQPVQEAFDEGVSDVLARPFTVSQLRARVETWLFRAGVAVDRRSRARSKPRLPVAV
ncbi:MAG TPA: MBL fold metallo-hydrolase [Chloroflexota bacterium]|nr:MBL fold metallo-hydrolase [Chloroflexota bacterium]